MKKDFLSIILMSFLVVFFTSTALAQQPSPSKVFKWKIQGQWPTGSSSYKPLDDYCKELKEITNGRLQLTLFPAGAIIPTKDIFASVRKGAIEGSCVTPSYWASTIRMAGVASNIPMTFANFQEGLDFHFNYGFEDMLKKAHAEQNIIYYTERIYPAALIVKKPIRTIADFKGMKLRSSGTIGKLLTALGASTIYVPGQELYMSLQTGIIEGAHWGAAGGAVTAKLCEIAKYFIRPDVAMTADSLIFNADAYNALPKDLQAILDHTLKARAYRRSVEYELMEQEAMKTMVKDYGVEIITLPKEDVKTMQAIAAKEWDALAAGDADAVEVIRRLRAFLKVD